MKRSHLLPFFALMLFGWPAIAQGQILTATITYPANGAVNANLAQPIQWTTVANVQAYYLYVGTTVGAKNLVDTGEISQTWYLATNLPASQTLYARLWTKVGGVWRSVDSTFSVAALTATITYPANGAVNANLAQPIQWTTVANVQAYYLYVGTTVGAKNLVDTGEISQTWYLATNLPASQTLYARLWTRVGGVWRSVDSMFSVAALTATITYPTNGAVNANLAQPIQWTTVANVQAYYLYVGTTVGAKNLVDTGEISQTSYLATNLPAGQTLYARLWTKVGGVWRSVDSTFSVAALTATITYPANGAVNANLAQPIQWTTVANVQAHYLYVGTTVGAKNLVDTGEISQTSYLATNLPAGQTLYARLWTKVGGVWRSVDSTFSVAALTATITYPANGAVNANLAQPIQWTTVANVQAHYLYVGTTVGAKNLVDTGEISQTSYLATNLPAGQTLYARLWTKVGGVWRSVDSTFTAAAPATATITYPANGAVNADLTQPIQWTSVANAQAYYLYLGTTPGASNLVNTGEILQTSYLADDLPLGQTIYVRMLTKVGGVWRHVDSTFTAASTISLTASLIAPSDGAVAFDQMQPFTWTTISGAQAYYLYVGSTVGAKNLLDSGETNAAALSVLTAVHPLPAGPTLYARLWTKAGGVWRYRDSTFTASIVAPEFVYPIDGAIAVDTAQSFQWHAPVNAQTQALRVGSTPGANDVFDSGEIGTTSVSVAGLPPSGVFYARASSKVNGIWRFTDIAFTLAATIPVSTIVVPENGEPAFDTGKPFEWEPVSLARGYRLTIGSSAGANDLHDSGEIHVTRRFVPELPLGALFGRIETKIDGQWHSSDFIFDVTANSVSVAHQIKSATSVTDEVRSMAFSDNRPFSWTELARRRYLANCLDYAETLLAVWTEMNGQLQAKTLDVALNPNGYDVHTLVEMFNSETQSWMLFDPTFDLTVRRTGDGALATAEDVSTATRTQQWGDVTYVYLGSLGDYYVRSYHLDYPLLFVDIYHEGDVPVAGQGGSVLPYMQQVAMPVAAAPQPYAIGCVGDQTASVRIDNVDTVLDCSGVDGLSHVFTASTIEPTQQTAGSVTIYRPRRFVF